MLPCPVLLGESHHALPLSLSHYKDSAFNVDLCVGGDGAFCGISEDKTRTNMEITGTSIPA